MGSRPGAGKLRRHRSSNGRSVDQFGRMSLYSDRDMESHKTFIRRLKADDLDCHINAFNLQNIQSINEGELLSRRLGVGVTRAQSFHVNKSSWAGILTSSTEAKGACVKDSTAYLNPEEDQGIIKESESSIYQPGQDKESQDVLNQIGDVDKKEDIESEARRQKQEQIKVLNHGIRRFNLNPKKGLGYLQDKGIIRTEDGDDVGNAKRVAKFLRTTRGLNKEQIGFILGEEKNKYVAILTEYMNGFQFEEDGATIQGLETGLRKVLSHFKPPGEGQKIDRILEAFATKFVSDNLSSFEAYKNGIEVGICSEFHPETTFIVAYLIIMLNVDLHHPNNATRRMNKKTFIERCRRLDNGKDLPANEVGTLYDRILHSEIKLEVDRDDMSGNLFTNPVKSGWLLKKGSGSISRWVRRWFILSENTLYYFKDSEDVEPQGIIPLENIQILSHEYRKHESSGSAFTDDHIGKDSKKFAHTERPRGMSLPKSSSDFGSGAKGPYQQVNCGSESSDLTFESQGKEFQPGISLKDLRTEDSNLVDYSPPSSSTSSFSVNTPRTVSEVNIGSKEARKELKRSFVSGPEERKQGSLKQMLTRFLSSPRSVTSASSDHVHGGLDRKLGLFGVIQGSRHRPALKACTFELRPCFSGLKVKSAKFSRHGDLVLGHHRTIKLRASSEVEAKDWVQILNQNRMMNVIADSIRNSKGKSKSNP